MKKKIKLGVFFLRAFLIGAIAAGFPIAAFATPTAAWPYHQFIQPGPLATQVLTAGAFTLTPICGAVAPISIPNGATSVPLTSSTTLPVALPTESLSGTGSQVTGYTCDTTFVNISTNIITIAVASGQAFGNFVGTAPASNLPIGLGGSIEVLNVGTTWYVTSWIRGY